MRLIAYLTLCLISACFAEARGQSAQSPTTPAAPADPAKAKDSPSQAGNTAGSERADDTPKVAPAPAACDPTYALFDSLHPPKRPGEPAKHWYDKLSLRGYGQIRLGRTVFERDGSAEPSLLGDRSVNGRSETFSIRRARLIVAGDVNDFLGIYFQTDFANTPADGTDTFFGQIRDLYADIYLDRERVNRLRVGQSKLPWGFEEMQSSSNRVPIDRSDAIDSGNTPNQRDLGLFYYWTPVEKQKLLEQLVDGGLKGTGNYGIFGLGVYNGQGGSQLDRNNNFHTVARVTWPVQLAGGQVVEGSLQGYTGEIVVRGEPIRPLGVGDAAVPANTGGNRGLREQRLAASLVWYPQPFGFQAEYNVGEGPGLDANQTALRVRPIEGGYLLAMLKLDTARNGIFTPYARFQHYRGGYRSVANAPYGRHDEFDFGVEWQISKNLELVLEYDIVDGVSLRPIDRPGEVSYRNFRGDVIRCQMQFSF